MDKPQPTELRELFFENYTGFPGGDVLADFGPAGARIFWHYGSLSALVPMSRS